MMTKLTKPRMCNEIIPYVEDSKKPDYKVFWINRKTNEKGSLTFFIYDYGVEMVKAVFNTMYPGREILQICEMELQQVS